MPWIEATLEFQSLAKQPDGSPPRPFRLFMVVGPEDTGDILYLRWTKEVTVVGDEDAAKRVEVTVPFMSVRVIDVTQYDGEQPHEEGAVHVNPSHRPRQAGGDQGPLPAAHYRVVADPFQGSGARPSAQQGPDAVYGTEPAVAG